jgi:hypothetical protein
MRMKSEERDSWSRDGRQLAEKWSPICFAEHCLSPSDCVSCLQQDKAQEAQSDRAAAKEDNAHVRLANWPCVAIFALFVLPC